MNAVCELVVKLELQYCLIETCLYELLVCLLERLVFFFFKNTVNGNESVMLLH